VRKKCHRHSKGKSTDVGPPGHPGKTLPSGGQAEGAVKKLEEDRVITTTVAILDPEKIGLDVIAIAAVSLEDHHPYSIREFDEMVASRPEILECYAMSGQHDYHLKIACQSIRAYEKLLREHIMPCRAVHHVNTSFVLRKNKYTTALPLGE
jgi:DNA-binding Lrp family transcriptional regulator